MLEDLFEAVYNIVIEDTDVFKFTNDLALYRYIRPVVYQNTDDYYYEQVQYGYMTEDEASEEQDELIWQIVADIMREH